MWHVRFGVAHSPCGGVLSIAPGRRHPWGPAGARHRSRRPLASPTRSSPGGPSRCSRRPRSPRRRRPTTAHRRGPFHRPPFRRPPFRRRPCRRRPCLPAPQLSCPRAQIRGAARWQPLPPWRRRTSRAHTHDPRRHLLGPPRPPEPCGPSGPSSRRPRTDRPRRQCWHHLHRRRHHRARHRGRHRRRPMWSPCRTGSCHALSCPCRSYQGANRERTLPFGGHHRGHRRGHQIFAASHGPYHHCLCCQSP
mmetsp:Transcript_6077/g.15028  ORF Transcript_6077/g.15028 Transcript_6077/m.15028 type:complete len:249 (-) Transcript_6077:72-818(-)